MPSQGRVHRGNHSDRHTAPRGLALGGSLWLLGGSDMTRPLLQSTSTINRAQTSTMPSLKTVQASNAVYAPKYTPTAVFVGGTSGIGRAMAEAFAKQTNGNANIIIVGRNKAAAEEIIATFPTPSSSHVKHEFISCNAQELKNVHETTQLILKKLEKINLLVLSAGGMAFSRQDTAEGNEVSLVLRTYSRVKFTMELMPLLEKAQAAGEDARVTSILAPAKGGSPDLQDLNLTKWSFFRAMTATGNYNDIAVKVKAPFFSSDLIIDNAI
jgi:hypothetical protein